MNLNKGITKFCQKCMGKLSRQDAEFFFNQGTQKDLVIFWSMTNLKDIQVDNQFDLEMMLVRYLQILMILSSVSDDPRDQNLVDKFMGVPFECEEIIKKRPPYKNPNNIDLTFQLIKERYPLPTYWDLGGGDTSFILAETPKKFANEVNRILENFSTPIVGMVAVLGVKPRDFRFFEELKVLAEYELNRRPCRDDYQQAVKWLLKLHRQKIA